MRKLTNSDRRVIHIQNIAKLLGVGYSEAKIVFKQLKALEYRGHKLAEQYCNGELQYDSYNIRIKPIKTALKRLIPPPLLKNVHLNGDPRGYFLKIDDDYMRVHRPALETDWGGYGILCPEGL
jgi:hypothetical protein